MATAEPSAVPHYHHWGAVVIVVGYKYWLPTVQFILQNVQFMKLSKGATYIADVLQNLKHVRQFLWEELKSQRRYTFKTFSDICLLHYGF